MISTAVAAQAPTPALPLHTRCSLDTPTISTASFSGTTHADKTGGGKLWMNTDHPQAARNCYFVSSCKDVRNMGDEQLNSALSYAEDHHIRGSIPDALKAEYQARATGKSHADLPMARGGYESPVYQP